MLLWKPLNTGNFHNKPETTVCLCIEYRMISRGLPTMAEPSTAILRLNNFDNIVLGTSQYALSLIMSIGENILRTVPDEAFIRRYCVLNIFIVREKRHTCTFMIKQFPV